MSWSTTTRRAGAALAVLAVPVVLVLTARWAWSLPGVQEFVLHYPGVASGATREGNAPWVRILHVLNLFFLVLVVRSGWAIQNARRPSGHWTRRGRPLLRKKDRPSTITLEQWFHVSLDLLWLANGAVFVALLFTSGRWTRLVPTSWDVLPNAASVVLQYLSLHWPHDDGWVAYNALQMLGYFVVVFLLAPLAAVTGLRMSELWPTRTTLTRVFPIEWARAVHLPVMVVFVAFVVVHVVMVLSTGAVRNLNHMFAGRDDDSATGVLVLAAVVVVLVGVWYALRPAVIRSLAALTGKVTR